MLPAIVQASGWAAEVTTTTTIVQIARKRELENKTLPKEIYSMHFATFSRKPDSLEPENLKVLAENTKRVFPEVSRLAVESDLSYSMLKFLVYLQTEELRRPIRRIITLERSPKKKKLPNSLDTAPGFDPLQIWDSSNFRLCPNHASAHNNLGTVVAAHSDAEKHFRLAININLEHAGAHYNLAMLYRLVLFSTIRDLFQRFRVCFVREGKRRRNLV